MAQSSSDIMALATPENLAMAQSIAQKTGDRTWRDFIWTPGTPENLYGLGMLITPPSNKTGDVIPVNFWDRGVTVILGGIIFTSGIFMIGRR